MSQINSLTSIDELVCLVAPKFKRALNIIRRSNAIARKNNVDMQFSYVRDLIKVTDPSFLALPGAGKVALESFSELRSFLEMSLKENESFEDYKGLEPYNNGEVFNFHEEWEDIDLFSLDLSLPNIKLLERNCIHNFLDLYNLAEKHNLNSPYDYVKLAELKDDIPALIKKHLSFRNSIDSKFHEFKIESFGIKKKDLDLLKKIDINLVHDIFSYQKKIRALSWQDKRRFLRALTNIKEAINTFDDLNFFSDSDSIDFRKFETYLIRRFESLLLEAGEVHREIILDFFGYHTDRLNGAEIASKNSITRQGVDEIVKRFVKKFVKPFNCHLKTIRQYIVNNIFDLSHEFNTMFDYFDEKGFYLFLKKFLGLDKDDMNLVNVKDYAFFVKSLFTEKYYTLSEQAFLNELSLNFDLSTKNALLITDQLIEEGILFEKEKELIPQNLTKHEAIANILLNHQSGLPWKDIANINNLNNVSKSKLPQDRLDKAFYDSELIYLSSQGSYRHTSFLKIDIDADYLFFELLKYVETKEDNFVLLMDFLDHINYSKNHEKLNYFELRYFIKMNCEKYNLRFNGRSGVDRILLGDIKINISQKDLLVDYLSRRDKACTKEELTKIIRSGSIKHTSFLLFELIKERKVVKIDEDLYFVPEKAFEEINTEMMLKSIDENMEEKIYEINYFKDLLNKEFDLHYSKSFYLSFINFHKDQYGWFVNRSLISKLTIEYKSLQGVIRHYCQNDCSVLENAAILQDVICIPRNTAISAIHNYIASQFK